MRKALLRAGKTAYSVITGKGTRVVSALFFAFFVSLFAFISIYARDAQAATNSTINFQARILQANGAVIPDGSVTVQFKIYDAATAGTNEWTETQSLTAKNGYVSASLGSVTSFPGTIDWSQEHWLTMNVNSDGEMGPSRMKMTAVPYSFRSGQADTLTNGTGTITAAGLLQLSPSTIQNTTSATPALQFNQLGAGALLKLQSSTTDKFTVSNAGDVTAAAGLTIGNSTSTTAGTIRWNGTAFEGYNGTSWTSLGGGLVVSSGATASFVSGLQNVAGTATGTNVEMLAFTSATAVSNTVASVGFTAPAAGSFRTCLVKNNAAITAGTLNLRWRVNGVSVGAAGCTMSTAAPRQDAGAIDAGVVTFNAGDTISVAFDTVGLLPAATNDFTVYWSVEYNSSSSSLTMQKVYDSSAAPVTVVTTNAKDVKYTLSNTATDSNFLVDIATGSTSKFAVQNNGTDIFNVNTSGGVGVTGNLTVSGTTTLDGSLIATGSATGTTGIAASPAQTNVTTVALTAAGAFANNDVIFINNAGQDYYTRIVSGGGTTTLTVSPSVSYDAGATITKYNVQNIGATATDYSTQANRFFQGYFLGGVVVGAGSTTISDGNIESTTTLNLQKNGGALVIGGTLNVAGTITGDASGLTNINASQISGGTIADTSLSNNVTILGNTFNGASQLVQLDGAGALPALDGSALTSLNASNISSGTVNDLRLSSNVTLKGNTFNGVSQLVLLDGSGNLPALNAAALTNINATNIASGTISDLRLSTNVTTKGNTFNGINQLVLLDGTGKLPSLDASNLTNISGSGITNLSASNLSSGTLDDLRLSSNVTLKGNTFNGNSQLVLLDGSGALPALNGSALTSLNASNISSGTINDLRLSTNVTTKGNTFNGVSQLVLLDGTGALPALNGGALTSLNASNISSGTLSDLRLSGNVTLKGNTFNGASGLVLLDGSGNLPALNGSALTTLNASNISSGTINDLRLSTNVTTKGNTFNGASQLVLLDGAGALPALNGAALTNLNATNLATGTVSTSLLSTTVTIMGNTFNGVSQLVQLDGTGALTALNGGALTSLNGSNITTGTVADARLSGNVALLNNVQAFTAQKTFNANIILGTDTASPTAGLLTLNDATGSNGFTSVLGTNTLTANRTLNLPDVNGTLMVLAPSAAQADASTTLPSIFINKTGATANIMTLQKGGTPVFSVLNSGALSLSLTDASAFNVTNGTSQFFDIDTTGTGVVKIGGTAIDGTATFLVLDSYNGGAADPAGGQNGAMYYNTTTLTNRCFENGIWKNCISQTTLTKTADQTITNNATFQNDNTLVLALAANSSYNIDAVINFSTTSAAADFKYTFTVPAGSTVAISTTADTAAAASTVCNITASGQKCTLASTAGYRGNIRLSGYIRTAGTAGNLQFQFAQNTGTAGQSVTVYQGSSMSYRKVQ